MLLMMILAGMSLIMQAQPPSDSSPTYPSGATKVYSSGTNTLTDETLSSSTQYYNVVQVSGGTLTMTGCTLTKTGDGSSGDNSSFYGNNSTIYAGSASSSGYSSTSSASGAVINISNCTVTSSSKGANAVFATNGATINVEGITITNNSSVSRGLHCTYGGKIVASDVDITTNEATSSTIATDRGGGTVTVTDGTATANGSKSAVLYSTGTITATNLTGTSAKGEIAVIEGDNSISMTNCTMTSGSSERGLLMMQSGSGDADGTNPVMTITGTSLTMTDESAPLLEVATCVTATCTLDNCTVTVPSGILMYVMDDDQWSTSGAIGNLVLSNGTYSGIVKYDDGFTANVTVNEGATWSLTADTSIGTLVNNGTIYTNGYTLTYTNLSGSGSISETAETVDITIGNSGKVSYCGDQSLDFSSFDEVKAYIATGFDKDEQIIWLTRVTDVPAGVPVLIKGTAGETYYVPVTDSQNSYYTNMFVGNTSGTSIQVEETDDDMVNYYLSDDGTFKSVSGYVNIGNNKCYLQLPGTFEAAVTGATQTVKVGSIGKASFAAPVDLDFTNVSGLKAFTATGYDKSTKTIWLTRVMKVQKGEGVLLKGDPNSYEIPSVAVQSSYENMFVGNTSGEEIQVQATSADGSKTNFYLKGDGTFVSVNGYVNIGNNKCYLELPTDMVAGAASTRGAEANYILEEPEVIKLPISFRSLDNDGDGTTAIRETKQLRDDGAYYTLQGQRVVNPGKGIYIKNGKKIVIK